MNGSVIRCGVVIVAVSTVIGCRPLPTTPTPLARSVVSIPPSIPPSPSPIPDDDPVGPAAGTYGYLESPPGRQPQAYTVGSRYILHPDGRFAMQVASGEYRGTYAQEGRTITFHWDSWRDGLAIGTLRGDRLSIEYNVYMMLTDFEDAVYQRLAEAPPG